VAGWLAGLVVRGFGFGLLGNIVVGFWAPWSRLALRRDRLFVLPGIFERNSDGLLGAVILLLIIRVVKRLEAYGECAGLADRTRSA